MTIDEKKGLYLMLAGWVRDKHSDHLPWPLWHNTSLGLFWIDTATAYEVAVDKDHALRK